MAKAKETVKPKLNSSSLSAISSSFFLTITNPATILSFLAIFAGIGLGTNHPNLSSAFALIFGIVLGSACWWLLLSSVVALVLHHRLSSTTMKNINKLSGLIMLGFGLWVLLHI